MNLRRFYTERDNLRVGSSVKLLDSEAAHIRDSLRMAKGDMITLFNQSDQYVARLIKVESELVMAEVIEVIDENLTDHSYSLTLYMSLVRVPQFELVLQKATELGATRIVPLTTEFSQIDPAKIEKKYPRWEKIILEAVKQSESKVIPTLDPVMKFGEVLENNDNQQLLLMTTPRSVISKISELVSLSKIDMTNNVGILIGPEGGFSPTEHRIAKDKGVEFVIFNNNILKAETAAISAVAIVVATLAQP